jgi:MFS family permease
LIAAFVYFLGASPIWAFLPVIAKDFANGRSDVFSIFMVTIGLGAVSGGLGGVSLSRQSFARTLAIGGGITAAAMMMIALAAGMPLSLAGFFLAGVGWIGVSSAVNSYVLAQADAALRGRAIAVVLMAFSGGMSLGSLIWGRLSSLIGAHGAFAAGAAVLAVGLLCLMAVRERVTSEKNEA